MKTIQISIDTFAKIWSHWREGEETEDEILRRVLSNISDEKGTSAKSAPLKHIDGSEYYTKPLTTVEKETRNSPRSPFAINRSESANFKLTTNKYNVEAYANYEAGQWTVLKGSIVMAEWIGKETDSSYEQLHASLLRSGTIRKTSGQYGEFSKNYTFTSPSAASAIVVGRSDNGRNSWRNIETGQTFNEWITD